jgi:outer membrane protein TolC
MDDFMDKKNLIACGLAFLLAACAGVSADQALSDTTRWADKAGASKPTLAIDEPARQALREDRKRLLQGTLDERAALDLALRSSAGAQALLAEGWALQSASAQGATWPRVGLAFERTTQGADVTLARTLSLGLAELITLPMRRAAADRAQQVQRLQLARDMLGLHASVRQQWIRTVAANQLVTYEAQVLEAAQAGDELAQRLQKVGNFSLLQRSREQAFAVDAQARLARARLAAATEREALARLLGLSNDEASAIRWGEQLPDRLSEVPKSAREVSDVARSASTQRLDLAVAQAQLEAATGMQRTALLGLADLEFALKKETGDGSSAISRELALSIGLPDSAMLKSQGASATALGAVRRLEQATADAASTLRERHAAYRTAHELALHYRDTVVPLRKSIADEMLLRYNGMLSSVFALLADARAQVGAVIAAIEAQRDFWLAEAALDAAILGAPSAAPSMQASMPAATNESAGGH